MRLAPVSKHFAWIVTDDGCGIHVPDAATLQRVPCAAHSATRFPEPRPPSSNDLVDHPAEEAIETRGGLHHQEVAPPPT